ncbi:MAG: SDR family oxidoreductase [Candidatus Moranbacteria bacterium]|nr:SDR family oxidoreductase [Candidatus Moranbacteria bacterium]
MNNEAKILITGCGGMLGSDVYRVFSEQYGNIVATDIDLNEDWLQYLDVRDIDMCKDFFEKVKPSIVIHLAALTDLEYCELNPEEAWKTNALGTENIALLAKKYDATMIYIGTAGIFGGEKDEFTDYDTPNPLSYYAKAKYSGECFVQQYLSKYYIFRAGWMMGGGIGKDKKFIKKIYNQIKEGKKELFVVDDKLGTPTYTVDFARSISKVIQTEYYGLYNQVCGGNCSRLDVANEFVGLMGLSDQVKVTKVTSDYFGKDYFAPRPYSEKLVNLKLINRKINFMRDWKVCLEEYSEVYREDFEKEKK